MRDICAYIRDIQVLITLDCYRHRSRRHITLPWCTMTFSLSVPLIFVFAMARLLTKHSCISSSESPKTRAENLISEFEFDGARCKQLTNAHFTYPSVIPTVIPT